MGDWVKLTRSGREPKPVWINLAQVRSIESSKSGSLLKFDDNHAVDVTEPPETIIGATTHRGRSM